MWKPFSSAIISQNASDLDIIVVPDFNGKLWNRAYLPLQINSTTSSSLPFNLIYLAKSSTGNASFFSEIRDNSSNKVMWSNFLNNTSGQFTNQTFMLPNSVLNKPVEFRFYVVTTGPGEHELLIKRANLIIPRVLK